MACLDWSVPDFWYERKMNGKSVLVEVHGSEDGNSVRINGITNPINEQEYRSYFFEYDHLVHPDKDVFQSLILSAKIKAYEFKNDSYMRPFWLNVAKEYERRSNGTSGGILGENYIDGARKMRPFRVVL